MSIETNVVHTGDCLDVLDDLPAESVHTVMTSPPYWNLRDYDHADQLGLEPTADEYVDNIAAVMDAVQRVLRPDGSLWLNLGDTYDNKDLQQIPARVAIELQSRGWMLRNRVTWAKPNPMPQSVKDRLNDTTEAVFHFVKNKDYWYDLDAIREEHAERSIERTGEGAVNPDIDGRGTNDDMNPDDLCHPAGKNPGDVFEVTTKPFPEAHFAVYPPELCEKPIKATVPPKVCAECGSPYKRHTEKTGEWHTTSGGYQNHASKTNHGEGGESPDDTPVIMKREFKGWNATCDCDTDTTESGIILDPFAGAGTTLLKAKELGRKFIGIELNPEYADMARARVGLTPDDPATVRGDDDQQGLEQF